MKIEKLEHLLHLHSCEQEGLNIPTAEQWFYAVIEAQEELNKIKELPTFEQCLKKAKQLSGTDGTFNFWEEEMIRLIKYCRNES